MELYKEKYKKLIRDYLIGYKPSYVEFLKKRYKGYKYICGFSVGNMGRGVGTCRCYGKKNRFLLR